MYLETKNLMEQEDIQVALQVLNRVREALLNSLVEDLIHHQEDDPSSYSIQEIEDRFAIRLSNLNTLIATLQDLMDTNSNPKIVAHVHEVDRISLEEKIQSLLSSLLPEELINFSIFPLPNERYLIILAQFESLGLSTAS